MQLIQKKGKCIFAVRLAYSYSHGCDVRFGRGHATTGISEVCKYTFKGRIVYLQERSFVHARDVSLMRVFDS